MSVESKNRKGAFTCTMCKDYKVGSYSYVFKTYAVLPKTPSEEFIICEKCAVRESGKAVKELSVK